MQRVKNIFFTVLKTVFCPRRVAATVLAFALLAFFRAIALHFDVFNPVAQAIKGFSTTDIFYDMMQATPADTSSTIVIVDITRLHNRDSIASVLEEIDALEPAAIDIDVVFEYPKEPVGDTHLFSVVATLSNAVFSFKMMDPDREKKEFTREVHSFFASELGVTEGFVNVDRSMIRDIPLCLEMRGKKYPSVIARMMEVVQGKPFDYQNHPKHPIDYEPTVFRIIPYDSIQHYAQYITGHIVMFGGAYESVDVLYTPLGQMHGINVLCYAMKTMLEMNQLTDCKGTPFWLLTFLLAYIGVCCIMSYKEMALARKDGLVSDLLRTTLVTSLVVFAFMTIYIIIAFWLFVKWHFNIDLTPTLSVMALATTSGDLIRIFIKHTKGLFKQ